MELGGRVSAYIGIYHRGGRSGRRIAESRKSRPLADRGRVWTVNGNYVVCVHRHDLDGSHALNE